MAGLAARHWGTLWLLIGWLALGCAPRPIPLEPVVVPTPEPIPLGEGGSHPLSFHKVVYRIPSGTVLGHARRQRGQIIDELRWSQPRRDSLEYNVAITDALRSRGYDVRDAADALFDPGRRFKVRYQLAAILSDAELDFEYDVDTRRDRIRSGMGTARVEVEVRLHDAVRNRVVYTKSFVGHGEDEGLKPAPIMGAVVDAVLQTTTDPEFVRLLAKAPGEQPDGGLIHPSVEITACERQPGDSLPADLPRMLRAVVEIQAGRSGGTGVIISPDGWVLTAAHVVDGAAELWVRAGGGALVPAEVHSSDARSDVALLRIPGREYPCVRPRLGAEELKLGSDVYAINYPVDEGHNPTITRGVVSGFPEQSGKRYIQTDASINPGSSGGPLLSSDGRIAGLTIKKLVGPGFEGVGYAVPIDDVVDRLAITQPED